MLAIALFCVALGAIFVYLRRWTTFWERRGLPYVPPTPIVGNLGPLVMQKLSAAELFVDLYRRTKQHRVVGIFNLFRPTLMVNDPDLVRDVLIKDFQHFHDRGTYVDEENDPLSGHLFSLPGDKWKHLRAKLTPTFTSGKLKAMLGTILECGDELETFIEKQAARSEVLEVREVMARYLTDIIVSVAFGIKIDSINNPNEKFRLMGKRVFDPSLKGSVRILALLLAPKVNHWFKLHIVDQDVEDFIIDMVTQTIEYREKNNVSRKDFFQLLLQLRNIGTVQLDEEWDIKVAADENKKLSIREMAAQSFVFFVAGFETSSAVISFTLYEMVKNPEVFKKAQESIDEVLKRHGGKFTYESLQEMTYLESCINESLRIYPSLSVLNRECTQDFKIPNSDVTIEKGTAIIIPVRGLQLDPQYFPEPEKFKPERFEDEAQQDAIKSVFLPFGQGPRVCIGMRLAKITSKIALARLLVKFDFKFAEGYDSSKLILDPTQFPMGPKGDFLMKATLRK